MNRLFLAIFILMAFFSPLAIGGSWPFTRTCLLIGVLGLLFAVFMEDYRGNRSTYAFLEKPFGFLAIAGGSSVHVVSIVCIELFPAAIFR